MTTWSLACRADLIPGSGRADLVPGSCRADLEIHKDLSCHVILQKTCGIVRHSERQKFTFPGDLFGGARLGGAGRSVLAPPGAVAGGSLFGAGARFGFGCRRSVHALHFIGEHTIVT